MRGSRKSHLVAHGSHPLIITRASSCGGAAIGVCKNKQTSALSSCLSSLRLVCASRAHHHHLRINAHARKRHASRISLRLSPCLTWPSPTHKYLSLAYIKSAAAAACYKRLTQRISRRHLRLFCNKVAEKTATESVSSIGRVEGKAREGRKEGAGA